MERRCRCHGLSGSCSIKTCWLALPSFELIGAYLKRKYESSVHLASAVNVNKLLPMMDRNEISAILSGQPARPEEPPTGVGVAAPGPSPVAPSPPPLEAAGSAPAHFEYYERHRLAERTAGAAGQRQQADWTADTQADPPELPDNLTPLTGQQYQSLLRESKLCNTSSSSARPAGQQVELPAYRRSSRLGVQLGAATLGQQLKSANQHLSHLLSHSNREDLVYLHKSPDFCSAEPQIGLAGVSSRYCSENPAAPDYCDIFCCGRGYTGKVIQHKYTCECAWEYCCDVKCKVCTKEIKISVCN